MRLLTWFITLPIILAVLVFALQNRTMTTVSFWPFDLQFTLPLSFLLIGVLLVGFALGRLSLSLSLFQARRQTRHMEKEVSKLNDKLQTQNEGTPQPCEAVLFTNPRYQLLKEEKTAPPHRFSWFERKKK